MNLLLTVVTLLVVVATKFHPSICFQFTSSPPDPLVVVLGRNSTNVTMGWQFTFDISNDLFAVMKVFRSKKGITDSSQFTQLVLYDAFGVTKLNYTLFTVNISAITRGPPHSASGYLFLTIKDILRQPNDKGGSVFDPQSQAYIYRLDVTLSNLQSVQTSQTECLVYFLPGTPSISIQPDQQVLCQGDTVNVTCNTTVGNPENTTITFYRNNQIITAVQAATLNGKVTKAMVTVALTSGINSFRCQATNLVGSSESTATVNVTGKERPVVTNCSNKTVVEGTNLLWTCDASGGQPLTISWFKGNNNTAISSGKTLNITSIKRADAGMYRFTASNGAECPTASITVYLTVQFLPGTPSIHIQPDQQVLCQGDTVNMTCNTTVGNPENTTITFYRNNQIIAAVKAETLNGKVTKAAVAKAMTSGINSFRCQATNLVGSSESTATVNVTGKERPVVTNCNNRTVVEGTNLLWTCDASGGQPLTISWFKGNNNTVISSGKTLNITSIKRADAGMYRFNVSNGAECPTASITVYLTVQYPPTITDPPGAGCKSLSVNEHQNVTLACTATGEPTPNITWEKDGEQLGSEGSPLVLQNVLRNQTGNYTCTADNGIGHDTACWNVNVQYFQSTEPCGERVGMTTEQCSSVNPDGNPFPSVTCQENVTVTLENNAYKICGEMNEVTSTCSVSNTVGKCSFELEVHNQTNESSYEGRYKLLNLEYEDGLKNESSTVYKYLKSKNEDMLNITYKRYQYVTAVQVTGFEKGSVIVNYKLILTAAVSDPSLPLKQALNSSTNGTLNGLTIDPSSITAGRYIPSTTPPPTTTVEPKTSTESPPLLSTEAIIAISVVVPLVVIVIIVLACCYCKKRERKTINTNGVLVDAENNPRMPMGTVNQGVSPSPSTHTKQPGNQAINNNQHHVVTEEPAYAAVDKTKKKPKDTGEITYAALADFQDGSNAQDGGNTSGRGGIVLEPLPKGQVQMPPKYEDTVYAEIVGFKKPVTNEPATEEKASSGEDNENQQVAADVKPQDENAAKGQDKQQGPPSSTQHSADEKPPDENTAEDHTQKDKRQDSPSSTQHSGKTMYHREDNSETKL